MQTGAVGYPQREGKERKREGNEKTLAKPCMIHRIRKFRWKTLVDASDTSTGLGHYLYEFDIYPTPFQMLMIYARGTRLGGRC